MQLLSILVEAHCPKPAQQLLFVLTMGCKSPPSLRRIDGGIVNTAFPVGLHKPGKLFLSTHTPGSTSLKQPPPGSASQYCVSEQFARSGAVGSVGAGVGIGVGNGVGCGVGAGVVASAKVTFKHKSSLNGNGTSNSVTIKSYTMPNTVAGLA